ncbi:MULTISPECIES: hypothetical protein [unclassified Vibrio]|nr:MULTISPECIES: hypothetical protein [unclassified Vibrio]MDA0155902.1 hypothetical protein [Vibrio sp. Makdt]CAH7051637.1 hypothetical protein VCHA29O37_580003 [Vibrio chagasii]
MAHILEKTIDKALNLPERLFEYESQIMACHECAVGYFGDDPVPS